MKTSVFFRAIGFVTWVLTEDRLRSSESLDINWSTMLTSSRLVCREHMNLEGEYRTLTRYRRNTVLSTISHRVISLSSADVIGKEALKIKDKMNCFYYDNEHFSLIQTSHRLISSYWAVCTNPKPTNHNALFIVCLCLTDAVSTTSWFQLIIILR